MRSFADGEEGPLHEYMVNAVAEALGLTRMSSRRGTMAVRRRMRSP